MTERRFARQLLALGERGQTALGAAHVGLVGLGGLGSHLAQGLAYLGVRSFVLVDPDRVDQTTLNRMVGAYPCDVGRLKVGVIRRHIRAVRPGASVTTLGADVRHSEALRALRGCELILAGVDRDAPRLVLTELAAAYKIPFVDSATEIFVENGQITDVGGRVVVARPGDYCLVCADQLDLRSAGAELASPGAQVVARRHGYGLGPLQPTPSVVALNGVVANLALMEVLALITGWREPSRHLTFKGMRGVVTARVETHRPGCYVCERLVGAGEAAQVERYALASKQRRLCGTAEKTVEPAEPTLAMPGA